MSKNCENCVHAYLNIDEEPCSSCWDPTVHAFRWKKYINWSPMPLRRRISFVCAWYDIWVGAFWDREHRALYILPVPMLGIKIQF